MRKALIALIALAVLATPPYAQGRGKGSKRTENSQQAEEKKRKEAEAERAYKDALKKIPDQKPSHPWAHMR